MGNSSLTLLSIPLQFDKGELHPMTSTFRFVCFWSTYGTRRTCRWHYIGSWMILRDYVNPVRRFWRYHAIHSGSIRTTGGGCSVLLDGDGGSEVDGAGRSSRLASAKVSAKEEGNGSGVIGLADDFLVAGNVGGENCFLLVELSVTWCMAGANRRRCLRLRLVKRPEPSTLRV